MKHTPAPWSVNTSPAYDDGHALLVWGPKGEGYGAVARTFSAGLIPSPKELEEAEANAHLIAAAPALLAALEAAKAHLEYCGYGDSWERECARHDKLAEQIQEALAQAVLMESV